ncbi:hypothetical protein D6850_03650 [Roseovarius spongiae]|uniref:Phytanoyl-CoA dioxygenase n=1 Tax=Roseovarius spongiae TaxID=2320272 RepID=A0A3A8AYS8_9RHOB|nr:hypothetical protein [Roseovarius spongiae]RKF16649.1 hypothetical protein D6850_03650 [Roseovarius spongiae]
MVAEFLARGWARFPCAPEVAEWAGKARAAARASVNDAAQQSQWLQCGGTWFVGVDALPNAADGAVAGSGALAGPGYAVARRLYGALPLHRAQVSVVYPGYPKPREGEGEGAFRYRLKRDAAHVDGLLAVGDERVRMLKERHAYILGLPLNEASPAASPLVVWEGSHEVMRAAFARALDGVAPADWGGVDLTEIYTRTRREVFETCPRVPLPARPGEATLVHRLTVHGVAPWSEGAEAGPEGRMIAYFRPELPGGDDGWLRLP